MILTELTGITGISYRTIFCRLGVSNPQIKQLDEVTENILNRLGPPLEEEFDVRGLVLGRVQSGKTANYTALISKAADAGYRLIIVLAGTDNALRLQTQLRLKKD